MTGLNPIAVETLRQVISSGNVTDDEDCRPLFLLARPCADVLELGLTVNVFTPTNATQDSMLPVVFVGPALNRNLLALNSQSSW